jgi:hypothetical protein
MEINRLIMPSAVEYKWRTYWLHIRSEGEGGGERKKERVRERKR